MKVDLTYDGHFIKWKDKSLTFKASSGLPGHQIPGEQCTVHLIWAHYPKVCIKYILLTTGWLKIMAKV